MVLIGKSVKNYMERRLPAFQPTYRQPGPVWTAETNEARTMPLSRPLPIPELQQGMPGQDPPEGQLTQRWPHGEATIT